MNFVQRFIPDCESIAKPINKFIRKDQDFECSPKAQREFSNIKLAIISSLVLVSSNFDKPFTLYSCSYEDTITQIIT